jgi:ribosome assembly protein YihI (activator of Der GTPase)
MKVKFKVRDYNYVKEVIESYEDEDILNDFLDEFEEGKEIKYEDYFDFCYNYIDDMSEVYYIKCNWNDEYDEE